MKKFMYCPLCDAKIFAQQSTFYSHMEYFHDNAFDDVDQLWAIYLITRGNEA